MKTFSFIIVLIIFFLLSFSSLVESLTLIEKIKSIGKKIFRKGVSTASKTLKHFNKYVIKNENRNGNENKNCKNNDNNNSNSNSNNDENFIPIIDISALVTENASVRDIKQTAALLVQACEQVGFFAIKNHGISDDIINAMWSNTTLFFDQTTEYKDKYSVAKQSEYPFGYSGIGGEVLKAGKDAETSKNNNDKDKEVSLPDLKELFSLGPENPKSGFPPREWPTQPDGFKDSWSAYYNAMENLASKILQGFAIGLGLERAYFEKYIDHHASAIRALNYPAYNGFEPPQGQLRASAHTDYGTITILKAGGPGLEVSKDTTPPSWVAAPLVDDGFIVNLGDLMRRWTNDAWLSTLHRVVNPKDSTAWQRRQSIAFFHNPNRDAVVVPIVGEGQVGGSNAKHEPIVAGEFLMQKHLAAVGST